VPGSSTGAVRVPNGVDAAIDAVGSEEALQSSITLVADRDRIVTIAASRQGIELGIKVIGAAPGADPEPRSARRLASSSSTWPEPGSSMSTSPASIAA